MRHSQSANELTAGVESIESQALDAWFRAGLKSDQVNLRWSCHVQGDATCYVSPTEPSILVNRVMGLGSERLPTLEQLVDIRKVYADAGIGRFFLHVLPERLGKDYASLLAEAGYKKYRGWMKFVRGPAVANSVSTDLSVSQIGADHAGSFAAIVGDAFDFGATFQPAIAALTNDENWRLYMGFDNGTPACTGGLYMKDGIGYLDFGATHPDFRRRGGQTAILNVRIREAFEAGCTSIVTMTGEAVAGDEQHSYRNILRAGFEEAYLRENWIPAET